MDAPTAIWNRACDPFSTDPSLRAGDVALRDALAAHSVQMNGGLMLLTEAQEQQLEALEDEYYELVPSDSALDAMFQARLAEHPEEFAPVAP